MTDSARPDFPSAQGQNNHERRTTRPAGARNAGGRASRMTAQRHEDGPRTPAFTTKESTPGRAARASKPSRFAWPTKTKNRRIAAAALASGSLLTTAALVSTITGITPAEALNGIDVASHQHTGGAIDWDSVASSGQRFAFIKATEGYGYTNPYFMSDTQKAVAAGLTVGSYHYAKPGGDARTEAKYYAKVLATAPQPSLPPVLDLEETGGLSVSELQSWVSDWVDEIEKQTGRTPIMYTYYSFWLNNMGNTSKFSNLPLWLAYYNDSLPSPLPGGWKNVTFWQHSGSGSVAGINTVVDLNTYDGTDSELKSLASGIKSSAPVAGVATDVKPAVDAGVASASVANQIQHTLQTSDNPALKEIGNSFNIPVPNTVLVALLGVAAGTVSLSGLWDTLRAAGFGGPVADQLISLITEGAQSSGLPTDKFQELLAQANGATLADVEKLLSSIADGNYSADHSAVDHASAATTTATDSATNATDAGTAASTTATQPLDTAAEVTTTEPSTATQ